MQLVAITLAIQGFAVLIIASACMWNFRRLADISRAVTRIENEIGMDVGRQKILCEGDRLGLAPESIVQATEIA